MALTKTVAKTSVALGGMPKLWIVTLTLTVADDDGPGFTTGLSQKFKLGNDIAALQSAFEEDIAAAVKKYEDERTYFTHNKMDTLVADINTGLEA